MEGDTVSMQEVVEFQEQGIDEKGKVVGKYVFAPIKPKFFGRILKAL